MWVWGSKSGRLLGKHLKPESFGYAGHGEGYNNPALQHVANVGPLPCGLYTIMPPIEKHPELGPYVLRLEPHPENEMFGRSAFCVHGERKEGVSGKASHGCIILGPITRRLLWESPEHTDHLLRVVDI